MPPVVQRVFVVGMGEVGRRLAAVLQRSGLDVVPVTREAGWEAARQDTPGLRLVCVREEALAEVVEQLRHLGGERLAFVQNGWLHDVLVGLSGCTRGLVWFTAKGEFFRVLRPSPFSGPAASLLAGACAAGGIDAEAVDATTFAALDAEKMGFNCVVGLPLAVHGVALATYLAERGGEARALFEESVSVCARALGVEADAGWWGAFLRAVEPLGWVRTGSAKALEARNGAVRRLARAQGVAVPVTDRLLRAVEDS